MGVLDSAELLLQARNYSGSGAWLDEANSHDAQLGSTSGADTNDPTFLPHVGDQYVWFPGANDNFVGIADAAWQDIIADFDCRADIEPNDWTPAGTAALISKSDGSPGQWRFLLVNTGVIRLALAGIANVSSTVATGFTDGTRHQVRLTRDQSTGDVTFYTRDAGTDLGVDSGWSQLGDVVNAATTFVNTGNTNPLTIGSSTSSGELFAGAFYAAWLSDTIDGTAVMDVDFADATEPFATFTEASSNASTVTINRAATGLKSAVVDTTRWIRGTDDYHEIPDDAGLDFAADEDFTLMTVARLYDVTPAADMILIAKKADLGTAAGYALYVDTTGVPQLIIADGTLTTVASGPSLSDGVEHVIAAVRDTATDDITVYTDGVAGTPVTDTTTVTLANAEVMRLGRLSGAGTNHIDGEDAADVEWREALSDADVATAGEELLSVSDLLAAAPVATASVTAGLLVLAHLGGAATGTATVTAGLEQLHALTVASAAAAGVAASLEQVHDLAATVTAAAAVVAVLKEVEALTATVVAAATVTADLTQTQVLAATVIAVGAAVAALAQVHRLAAAPAAAAAVAASLTAESAASRGAVALTQQHLGAAALTVTFANVTLTEEL